METIEALAELAKRRNQKTKIFVAKHPNATSTLLSSLYEENCDNLSIVEAIASNSNISIETLEKIAAGELTTTIVNNLLKNTIITKHILKILIDNKEIKAVSKYETVLKELSKKNSLEDFSKMKTKEKVYFTNSITDEEILSILLEEKNRKIKLAIASKSNLSEVIINKIVYTEDLEILWLLSKQENASEEVLNRIAMFLFFLMSKTENDEDIEQQLFLGYTLENIARHRNTTFNLLNQIIDSIATIDLIKFEELVFCHFFRIVVLNRREKEEYLFLIKKIKERTIEMKFRHSYYYMEEIDFKLSKEHEDDEIFWRTDEDD